MKNFFKNFIDNLEFKKIDCGLHESQILEEKFGDVDEDKDEHDPMTLILID